MSSDAARTEQTCPDCGQPLTGVTACGPDAYVARPCGCRLAYSPPTTTEP